MSKELEALIHIGGCYVTNERKELWVSDTYSNDYDIVYNSLARLEELDKLQEHIGCPLEIYLKIQYGLIDTIYVKRYETIKEYWDENGLQLEQKEVFSPRKIIKVSKSFLYYKEIFDKDNFSFNQYKKEFWLKEDGSE